jgi:hypothetical protein
LIIQNLEILTRKRYYLDQSCTLHVMYTWCFVRRSGVMTSECVVNSVCKSIFMPIDNSYYRLIFDHGKVYTKMSKVWLRNVVKCGKCSLAKFANFVYFCHHIWAEKGSNLQQKICKLCKAIFSAFYNISQPNFAILLILVCSFSLW